MLEYDADLNCCYQAITLTTEVRNSEVLDKAKGTVSRAFSDHRYPNGSYFCDDESSFASFTFADSSFFWTRATSV